MKRKTLLIALGFSLLIACVFLHYSTTKPYDDASAMQLLSRHETELTAVAEHLLSGTEEAGYYWELSDFNIDALPESVEQGLSTYYDRIARRMPLIEVNDDWISFLIHYGGIGDDIETGNEIQFYQKLIYHRDPREVLSTREGRHNYFSPRYETYILMGSIYLKGHWIFISHVAP